MHRRASRSSKSGASPPPLAALLRRTSTYFHHLGMEVLDLQSGHALIRLPFGDHLRNTAGGMHGGAIASLIDSAGGLAARTLAYPTAVATVEFKVNFLAPIRQGAVVADGKVIHKGRRITVSEVVVRDEKDRELARGLVTLIVLAADRRARGRNEKVKGAKE